MRRLLILVISISAVISINSCVTSGGNKEKKVAKGNRLYGGTLRINQLTPVITLYPYYIYDKVSAIVASQIHEGIVRLNPRTLGILPGIASRWEVDTTGLLYTFHLRKNVFFQDDACFSEGKGRKVTAEDFKYSMEALCTASPDNVIYPITFKNMVVGADEYYDESKKGKPADELKGVTVLNDTTLQIKLINRNPVFLDMLAGPAGYVIAREALEKMAKVYM